MAGAGEYGDRRFMRVTVADTGPRIALALRAAKTIRTRRNILAGLSAGQPLAAAEPGVSRSRLQAGASRRTRLYRATRA